MRRRWRGAVTFAVVAIALATSACGGAASGDPKSAAGLNAKAIDEDPIALLPGAVVVAANVDAKAMFASGNSGALLAQIAEKYAPIGAEAGFTASRDLERVYYASYSMLGTDVAAVLRGTFDPAKIDAAAQNHAQTKSGGAIAATPYAGRTLYTINNVGFVVLSPHTVLAGTDVGIRRALDRLHDHPVKRELAPWIASLLETPGAAFAIVGDFVNQPMPQVPLAGWINGVQAARVVGNVRDSGVSIAGAVTYPSASQATTAADGIRATASTLSTLALTGVVPRLQNLQVTAQQTDVQLQFGLDDTATRKLLASVATLP